MSNGRNVGIGESCLYSEFHANKAANSCVSQVEELDAPPFESYQLCFRLLVESVNQIKFIKIAADIGNCSACIPYTAVKGFAFTC
jgi:hypothetical protein